jgi:hypothetical protein
MFRFRPRASASGSRIDALRQLYRRFSAENTSEARGLRLLRDWLSPGERAELENLGYFEVVGRKSGKRYRIYHEVLPPNVYEIDEVGRLMQGLCFVPAGDLVASDTMLAQKIALETNEQSALAVANRFPAPAKLPRTNRLPL